MWLARPKVSETEHLRCVSDLRCRAWSAKSELRCRQFMRFTLSLAILCSVALAAASACLSLPAANWRVQAGKTFQRAGHYTVRLGNKRFQDAISAWGQPGSCRVVGSSNHAIATWPDRGIWVDLWTYGGMPDGENGCTSRDLIYVSEIRLTNPRWTTALGLRVGDPTTKLRRLYPRAQYQYGSARRRSEYYLVSRHTVCIGRCSAYELAHGVEAPQLTAQVRNGRVVAFWLPVGGQGE
jgi:hypothetical protein